MTQDEIIRMAREAGAIQVDGKIAFYEDDLERFAALVAAHEREACAKVCDDIGDSDNGYGCAAAIRARSENGTT